MKNIILFIFLLFTSNVNASPIIYGTTYAPNGQVTSTNLNGNFTNVSQVVNGRLDNTNADTANGYRFYRTVSLLPPSGDQGAVYFLTSDDTLNFDTGGGFSKSVSINSPTNGGVLYYDSGWTQSSIGAANTVLTSNGTIPSFSLTVGTSANNLVQLDGSARIPAVNGSQVTNITGTNVVAPLGTWISKSLDTPYQAASDGFVTAVCDVDNGDNFQIRTDSANPPTTVRQEIQTASGTTAFIGSMMSPVKKNDYYLIKTVSGTCSSPTIYFIPMGS